MNFNLNVCRNIQFFYATQELVSKAIASSNKHQFCYIFHDLNENPNEELAAFGGLSTFEKVLSIPKSREFIEICLQTGSDFHRVSFQT